MHKVSIALLVTFLAGCETYTGRQTNCFDNSLSFVAGDSGGCDEWVLISD